MKKKATPKKLSDQELVKKYGNGRVIKLDTQIKRVVRKVAR